MRTASPRAGSRSDRGRLMRNRKQVVVIGLGRFGSSLAHTLVELGHEVLGIDKNLDAVNAAADFVTQSVQADASGEEALKEIGVRNFDIGVVSIGEDVKSSILITLLLKRLGVQWVVSKAADELHGEILRRVGADRVVYPESETGVRVAHGLAVPAVVDYLKVIPGYGISKIVAPA
ncbi:MAG: TrkA family potassium uptake protein, partial [Planctomycetaceae bacterium]